MATQTDLLRPVGLSEVGIHKRNTDLTGAGEKPKLIKKILCFRCELKDDDRGRGTSVCAMFEK